MFLLILFVLHAISSVYSSKLSITNPIILHDTENCSFPAKVSITLHGEETFQLTLSRQPHDNNCNNSQCKSYHGIVNADIDTHSAFDLCNGLNGEFVYRDRRYTITPKRTIKKGGISIENIGLIDHVIVRDELFQRPPQRLRREIDYSKGSVKFLELYLVHDRSVYEFFERNVSYIEERSQRIANLLDEKFRHLRIRVILVGVEVWEQVNMVKVVGNSHTTLVQFMKYRAEFINSRVKNDNAQLITKMVLDNGKTAGKAPIATICTARYSAGLNHDSHNKPEHVANVIAHELGHNLGMHHDHNNEACGCLDHPKSKCIMSHQIDAKVKSFSKCSEQYFNEHIRQGHGSCLFDFPENKKKPSICGNGIIENEEECDCGHPENCAKFGYCCHQVTCKLFRNATCASGECCENCQFKPRKTMCRQQRGECDLPEFCLGNQATCPADVHIQDTHSCSAGKGYCTSGVCMTHRHQCQEMFGNKSVSANGYCFKEYNTKGLRQGHCGEEIVNEITQYKACQVQDAYCGKLQCDNGHDGKITWTGGMVNRIKWRETGVTKSCVSKKYYPSDLDVEPGLVRVGTRCGHESVCLNQKCLHLFKYRQAIKFKKCPKQCSRKGVCNSKTHCHCNKGWKPPYCNEKGEGGSIDSGPPSYPSKDSFNGNRTLYIIMTLCLVSIFIVVIIFIIKITQRIMGKCYDRGKQNMTSEELYKLIK